MINNVKKMLLFLCLIIIIFACDYSGEDNNSATIETMATKAVSGNMITNGDFSNGTNGWYLFKYSGTVNMSVENGAMVIDLQSSAMTLGQTGLTFKQNKSYLISFKAKADSERIINVRAGKSIKYDGSVYPKYSGDRGDMWLTSSYKRYVKSFTMTEPFDANASLEFYVLSMRSPIKIYIDDVVVKEITNNVITNSNFQASMQGWEGYIREGTFGQVEVEQASNKYAKVSHYSGDDHPDYWDLELKKTGLTFKMGKTYVVSFEAWTRRIERMFTVRIGLHEEPWTRYGGDAFFLRPYNRENSSSQKHSFYFTMNETTDFNAYMAFQCGGDYGRNFVYIDNVVLAEVDTLLQ